MPRTALLDVLRANDVATRSSVPWKPSPTANTSRGTQERGRPLDSGQQLTPGSIPGGPQPSGGTFKVRLESKTTLPGSIEFDVTPEVSEQRQVSYKTIEPVHSPGQIYAYHTSQSRTYSLSGVKLLSRNQSEAEKNLDRLHLLRAWSMPVFGSGSSTAQWGASPQGWGGEKLGSPPPILLLTAYSPKGPGEHIYQVPVVITNMSIQYPSDVDYINTKQNTPMPTLMNIDIQLAETHAPMEYEKFNLGQFRTGTLESF